MKLLVSVVEMEIQRNCGKFVKKKWGETREELLGDES